MTDKHANKFSYFNPAEMGRSPLYMTPTVPVDWEPPPLKPIEGGQTFVAHGNNVMVGHVGDAFKKAPAKRWLPNWCYGRTPAGETFAYPIISWFELIEAAYVYGCGDPRRLMERVRF